MSVDAPPTPGTQPKRKSRVGLFCGLILLVLAFVVGLLLEGAGHVIHQQACAALQTELAPADQWEIDLGIGKTVKVILGQPIDLHLEGTNVRPKDGPPMAALTIDCKGLVFDRQAKKASSCESINVDVTFAAAGLSDILRRELLAAKAFNELEVTFGENQIDLTGRCSPRKLGYPQLAGVGDVDVDITTTPELTPPATIALRCTKAVVHPPTIPGLNLPQDIELPAAARAEFSREVRYDFSKELPGVALQTCTADASGLRVKGTVDPAVFLR